MNRKRFFRTLVGGLAGLPLVASVLGRTKPSQLTIAKIMKAREILDLQAAERIINPMYIVTHRSGKPWEWAMGGRYDIARIAAELAEDPAVEKQVNDAINHSTLDNPPPIDSQSSSKFQG